MVSYVILINNVLCFVLFFVCLFDFLFCFVLFYFIYLFFFFLGGGGGGEKVLKMSCLLKYGIRSGINLAQSKTAKTPTSRKIPNFILHFVKL